VQDALASPLAPTAPILWDASGAWTEIATIALADAPDVDGPLAPVIDLDAHRARQRAATPATFRRRRLGVLGVVLGLALSLVLVFGGGSADAGLEDPVGSTAVLEPGQTLWDLAQTTAPAGTSTEAQLARIRDLNGFAGASLPAWTVVLLPPG